MKSRLGYYPVLLKYLCISVLFLSGCATAWKPSGSFYQTTTTKVSVACVPDGKVFINNSYVGDTPIVHAVQYEKEIEKQSRKVSFWITQPGLSVFVTIVSLGLYIPFSFIPVDVETSLQPTGTFRNNEFNLQILSEGYRPWQKNISCGGDDKLSIDASLERKGVGE